MQQWKQAVKGFFSDTHMEGGLPASLQKEPGLRGGGSQSSPDHKYMIYVINSARYELARQILAELKQGKAVLLIADECHHYTSAQNQLIFEFIPYIEKYRDCFFSLGISATLPAGEPQRYLTSVLGKFSQGERYEFLRSLSGNKNRKIAETASYYLQLSYKRKSLVCLASVRISCACDLIRQLDSHEKILIFSERISQAEELYQLLQESYAEKIGRYHSKMGKQANKNVLERCLRLGSIRSDWLLEKSVLEEQIQKARYTSDKNYWICMKKLSQISGS
ncbi:MAG: DEAD/DEAH box helicase family protein [Lachnospiraceae bacterium]|nr:DEAD/DEAH box helicase family protein [Lachnospiraceae bacterium]